MTTSSTAPKRLIDLAKPWITKYLKEDESLHHEPVRWEVGLTAFPDIPAASPSIVGDLADPSAVVPLPALVVFIEIPGDNPGDSLYGSPILAPYLLSEQRVREALAETLTTLRDGRKAVADSQSEA